MAEGLFARDLVLSAPDGRAILRGASLEVPSAARVWIEGPPGSGKRALLKVLAGLLQPESGETSLHGIRLWPGEGAATLRGRVRLGFAFAKGGLLSNQTLRENLTLPLRYAGRRESEVDAVMERFGLSESAGLRPHALSARARKLAQLARIEAHEPEVIFLSEPFEDLEGADLNLARATLQRWAESPNRLLVLSAEVSDSRLLPGARRFRLEAGRIHPVEEAP